jgi:hypothetical protein
MQSRYFDITKLKQYYKGLTPRQQWLVIGAGLLVAVLLLIALGRWYTQLALPDGNKDEEAQRIFREADQQYRQDEYQQAASGFEDYADRTEGYASFHGFIRAGRSHDRAGSHQASVQAFQNALEVQDVSASEYPFQHGRVHNGMSRAYQANGKVDKALSHAQRRRKIFQELDPETQQERQQVQQILDSGQNRIQSLQKQRLNQKSQQARKHADRADELMSGEDVPREQMRKAVEKYQQAVTILSENPDIAKAQERRQNYQQEIEAIRSILAEE